MYICTTHDAESTPSHRFLFCYLKKNVVFNFVFRTAKTYPAVWLGWVFYHCPGESVPVQGRVVKFNHHWIQNKTNQQAKIISDQEMKGVQREAVVVFDFVLPVEEMSCDWPM